ncbi:MAG: transcriptional regulator, GntR family [Homoserinimonas sp.]|nr:transcriptional regulator, GntR family [Homoserinimonas sp.]
MKVAKTEHGASAHRIADGLRESILAGEVGPGERVRQEMVAAQYGASRVPVREALRILEAEGLVTLVANTGAWVSRLSLAECEELYQIRERLEPLLLRFSIPNLSGEKIAELHRLAFAMETGTDVEAFLRLDRDFHWLSYSDADTNVLGETVQRLWNATQHYRRAFTRLFTIDAHRTVHQEHHLIVHAIEQRDVDDAERVLYGHIRRTRLELARHPQLFDHADN